MLFSSSLSNIDRIWRRMVLRARHAVPLLIRNPFCCANWRGVHCSRSPGRDDLERVQQTGTAETTQPHRTNRRDTATVTR